MEPKGSRSRLYGVIVLLVVALIVSSSFAVLYYTNYTLEVSNNQEYISELNSANTAYNETARNYNSALQNLKLQEKNFNGSVSSYDQLASTFNLTLVAFNTFIKSFAALSEEYNISLSLLTASLAALNTSSSAYITSSMQLTKLWNSYLVSVRTYENVENNISALISNFKAQEILFNQRTNQSLSTVALSSNTTKMSLFTADLLFDFGNGTKVWYNDTAIQPGWNVYITTLVLTRGNMNATFYPSFGEHYVYGLFGTLNTQTNDWFLWTFGNSTWSASNTGSDLVPVYNGSIIAWSYCGENATTFLPGCTSP